jgi:hypothetical protein
MHELKTRQQIADDLGISVKTLTKRVLEELDMVFEPRKRIAPAQYKKIYEHFGVKIP